MLVIGERINSTRPKIREAIQSRNASVIAKEVRSQVEAGAHYVDVNCAMGLDDEVQDIDWVVSVIQSESKDVGLCVDSPNYLAIERALMIYKGRGEVIINSITADDKRINAILPLALKYRSKLIALTMTKEAMPDTAQGRFEAARDIFEKVRRFGFDTANLLFDPLTRPISTEAAQAKEFLESIPMIKALGAGTVCGLSNISFGLPKRAVINSVFLAMAIQRGLDAAILDPLDKNVMSAVWASKALLGTDEYCVGYLKAFREGKLL